MLESEGYVEVRNGTGVIVKNISSDDLRNLMHVRKSLEMLAAETAIHNIREIEIDQMEQSFIKLLKDHKKKKQISVQDFTSRDYQLHDLLVERCNNKYIKNIMDSIHANIKRFQSMSFVTLNNLSESTEQHLNLLRLIRSRDSELLSLALARHIDWARDCISPDLR
jgi:DNA-binding GntR family transcriptional regulator